MIKRLSLVTIGFGRQAKTPTDSAAGSPKRSKSTAGNKRKRSGSLDSNLPHRVNQLRKWKPETSRSTLQLNNVETKHCVPKTTKSSKPKLEKQLSRSVTNLAANSNSPRSKRRSYAASVGLSSNSQRSLVLSWNRICADNQRKGAVVLGRRILVDLCAGDSSINSTFIQYAFIKAITNSECTVRSKEDHAKLVADALGEIVAGLDDGADDVRGKIIEMGKKHAELQNFGFKPKFWDKFGGKFVDVVGRLKSARKFPDSVRAWTALMAAVIDALNAGFMARKY